MEIGKPIRIHEIESDPMREIIRPEKLPLPEPQKIPERERKKVLIPAK